MTDWPAIIAAHEAILWRTAYRVLNHSDDALECCQEAWLDAYEYSRTHQVDEWAALLTSFVTRRAIDRLRNRFRLRHAALDDVAEPATDADCPVQSAEAAELLRRLRSALVALPEKQAQVWWLSSVEQLTHEQIGRLLKFSQNESRVLLHRARSQLASQLERQSSAARRCP